MTRADSEDSVTGVDVVTVVGAKADSQDSTGAEAAATKALTTTPV